MGTWDVCFNEYLGANEIVVEIITGFLQGTLVNQLAP
jgi:hypothetical protein